MSDNLDELQRAVDQFDFDEDGCHLSGPFFDLGLGLRTPQGLTEEENNKLRILSSRARDDLWNISTLIERLNWSRKNAKEVEHISDMWRHYVKMDISQFHVEMRAIMDYVAQIIATVASEPGQMPDSFRKLVQGGDKYEKRINSSFHHLIEKPSWFKRLRSVRDNLIHGGHSTIVFGSPSEGLIFQISRGLQGDGVSCEPYLHYNENVLYFDRYAALHLAYLLNFLDDVGRECENFLNLDSSSRGRNYSPGYEVINRWMTNLIEEIKSTNSV